MELKLLGPVEIVSDGRHIVVGPPQRRTVLAVLAAAAGLHVSTDMLIERVWDRDPPDGARRVLQSHISRLKRLMGQFCGGETVRLVRRSDGYVLEIDKDIVDLHRFRRMVRHACNSSGDCGDRAAVLRRALALRSGEPLAGLPTDWASRMRASFESEYVRVVGFWANAELAIGNFSPVLSKVGDLVVASPLNEQLVAVLMRAFESAGHRAKALDLYVSTCRNLQECLDAEPSYELQALYQAMLKASLAAHAVTARRPLA